jgi:hypothetical protein
VLFLNDCLLLLILLLAQFGNLDIPSYDFGMSDIGSHSTKRSRQLDFVGYLRTVLNSDWGKKSD